MGNDKTLPAFVVLTAGITAVLYFGANLSGIAGLLVAVLVAALIAIVAVGAWAIGKNLSK